MDTIEGDTEAGDEQISNIYTLLHPIDFGKEHIDSFELKPTGRAMRDFSVKIGDKAIELELFKLCELGLTLAGKPRAIADKMHPADITGLGMLAMAFIMPGQTTGKIALQ